MPFLDRCGVMMLRPFLPFPITALGCSLTFMSDGECPMASCHPNDGAVSHHPPAPSHHSSQYCDPSLEFPYL